MIGNWRKSSASAVNNCVEVSLPQWRKATASGASDCVEVAIEPPVVLIRHSKHPDGPRLRYSVAEWRAFLEGVRGGEFDLPKEPS